MSRIQLKVLSTGAITFSQVIIDLYAGGEWWLPRVNKQAVLCLSFMNSGQQKGREHGWKEISHHDHAFLPIYQITFSFDKLSQQYIKHRRLGDRCRLHWGDYSLACLPVSYTSEMPTHFHWKKYSSFKWVPEIGGSFGQHGGQWALQV